jgi:hypothetical protein
VEGAAGHEGRLGSDAGGEEVAPQLPRFAVVRLALADEVDDVAGELKAGGGWRAT